MVQCQRYALAVSGIRSCRQRRALKLIAVPGELLPPAVRGTMATSGRGVKRRQLYQHETLRELIHMSGSSVSAVMKLLQKLSDLEILEAEVPNRQSAQLASLEVFAQVRHLERLTLENGKTFDWEMCEPNLLLAYYVGNCAGMRSVFEAAARRRPCNANNPWSLVVAFDEFSPGKQMKSDNLRKVMNLSFSFLELGSRALSTDVAWVTPVVVRHSVIREVAGGWCHMLRQYLRLHLCGPTGIATAGTPLHLNGKPFVLFAKLTHLLADCDGFQYALAWRGTSSTKPCPRHWNVLMKGSPLQTRPGYVDITCADSRAFKSASAQDIVDYVDLVHLAQERYNAGAMSKEAWTEVQQVCGFGPSPTGVLTCPMLRRQFSIADVLTSDWMHNALQDGTVTIEAFLFISEAAEFGASRQELESYMRSAFKFPRHLRAKGNDLYRVFNEYRFSESKLRVAASEMLTLYSLLRHYVDTRVEDHPALAAKRASFYAACATLDIILRAKRGLVPLIDAGRHLRAALDEHMQKHIAAYGKEYIRPKHHLMYDVAEQMLRDGSLQDGILLDMFIVERTHLNVKAIANNIDNTSSFERSVLSGLMIQQTRRLSEAVSLQSLTGSVRPFPGFPMARCSTSLCVDGRVFSVGDVAICGGSAGVIVACAEEGHDFFVVAEEMVLERRCSLHSQTWRRRGSSVVWSADRLEQVMAWIPEGNLMTVLRLPH